MQFIAAILATGSERTHSHRFNFVPYSRKGIHLCVPKNGCKSKRPLTVILNTANAQTKDRSERKSVVVQGIKS